MTKMGVTVIFVLLFSFFGNSCC